MRRSASVAGRNGREMKIIQPDNVSGASCTPDRGTRAEIVVANRGDVTDQEPEAKSRDNGVSMLSVTLGTR